MLKWAIASRQSLGANTGFSIGDILRANLTGVSEVKFIQSLLDLLTQHFCLKIALAKDAHSGAVGRQYTLNDWLFQNPNWSFLQ